MVDAVQSVVVHLHGSTVARGCRALNGEDRRPSRDVDKPLVLARGWSLLSRVFVESESAERVQRAAHVRLTMVDVEFGRD